jgi:hypothetical protein
MNNEARIVDDRRMPNPPASRSPARILKVVLERALAMAWEDIAAQRAAAELAFQSVGWSECVKNAWLRSLREAFAELYHQEVEAKTVAVFGGKPRASEDQHSVKCGIEGWQRWEYMYDVAVVSVTMVDAAYARNTVNAQLVPRPVPFVQRAIWLVESEVALNGTEVAIDASKLRLGRSENMLLIAAQTGKADKSKWLRFLGEAMRGCEGTLFLALIPSYASGKVASISWQEKTGEIAVYQCDASGLKPSLIDVIPFGVTQEDCQDL